MSRDEYLRSAEWGITTSGPWEEYVKWLEKELPLKFEATGRSARVAHFRRSIPHDVIFYLSVERLGDAPLEVQLKLVGDPW